MAYSTFILFSITAACVFAAVWLGALWLLAPRLLARAGLGELRRGKEPGGEEPACRVALPAADPRVTFAVRGDQLKMLAGMLRNETPENIAIVLSRMPSGLRHDLLSLLDKDLAQRALVSLAAVRFVGKDMLEDLKQEIEKRLDGVVGGVKEAVELIASLPYSERREVLARLDADPQLASEVRAFIILDEDLLSLSEKDMGVLAAALPPAEMAGLLRSLPDKLQDRIKERLDPKVLEAAEQEGETLSPGADKKSGDLEKFMAAASALAASGRIARPAPSLKAPPAAVRAAAVSSDW